MKTVKVCELRGVALDWAVAKCKGLEIYKAWPDEILVIEEVNWIIFSPSTDWSQGGPIIDREEIDTYFYESLKDGCGWYIAEITGTKAKGRGHTRLVAAMRCYCCAKLGEFVDIPEELCQQESN